MGRKSIALAGMLLTAGVAHAAEPDAAKAKDSRECRQLAGTGTRIKTSECHLRSEWVAIDEVRLKQAEEMQRRLGRGTGTAPSASNIPH